MAGLTTRERKQRLAEVLKNPHFQWAMERNLAVNLLSDKGTVSSAEFNTEKAAQMHVWDSAYKAAYDDLFKLAALSKPKNTKTISQLRYE